MFFKFQQPTIWAIFPKSSNFLYIYFFFFDFLERFFFIRSNNFFTCFAWFWIFIIFTNFLREGPENRKIQWEKIVGGILTVVSLIELYISSKNLNPTNYLPVFLNISSIILVGFFLELSFIEKSKKSVMVKRDVIQNQDKSISNGNFREVLVNHS